MKCFITLLVLMTLLISCSNNDIVLDFPPDKFEFDKQRSMNETDDTVNTQDEKDIKILLNEKKLNLIQVLKLARLLNPELKTATYKIQMELGHSIQSGLFQNPELEVEWDDLSLNGNFTDDSVIKAVVSQEISLGGKYSAAKKAGMANVSKAIAEYDEIRWHLYRNIIEKYLNVDIALQNADVSIENLELAIRFKELTEKLSEAGSVPKFYLNRASVDLARAEMIYDESKRKVEVEVIALVSTIGLKTTYNLELEILKLAELNPPTFVDLIGHMKKNNPTLLTAREEILAVTARKEAARAEGTIDITISGGFTMTIKGKQGLSFGLGIPLPIFNRNQGEIKSSIAEIAAANAEFEKVNIELSGYLKSAYKEMQKNRIKFIKYEKEIIPSMNKILQVAELGFKNGEFSALEIMEAKKSLLEVKSERLEVMRELWFSVIELQFLAASPEFFNPFEIN
ncbi:MAG: TolC family protein [Planctomycetes bacterium]|nr:TolC family protein [Planctomycetota bacterium]